MTNEIAKIEADFTTVLVPGSIKGAMKSAGAGSRDLWQVAIDSIEVIDGFNPRLDTPDYEAHIRTIADSIKSEGFYQDQPLAGYVKKVDGGNVICLISGHTRLRAVKIAVSEGAEITRVPMTVSQDGISMEDLAVALIRGNGGRALTYFESAVVCKRLISYGLPIEEIARRVGFTSQQVKHRLSLMAAPFKLREMVAKGNISASVAIEMITEHGEKALAKIEESMETAKEKGKTKVTKAHTPGAAFKKFVKKAAPVMHKTLEEIKSDPGYESLTENIKFKLEELLKEIGENKEQQDVDGENHNQLPLVESSS